ncbi:uncharacterized protein LOC131624869 [Vicia villosa]|uniref:uncharacterized protein LOC131624869 n=1 Tax=Vicia villosa TaxID=3911 RepID=UPI00273C31A0|nr:uncharacterized protein LOC131624869 [Vicia villosa]
MERKSNQNDSSSSSSFVSELSGSKETHSSSSPSPNEVRDKANKEKWDSILGTPDVIFKACGGGSQKTQTHEDKTSIYQDQRIEPCNLSSSIFYGGQDIIPHAQNIQNEEKNLWAKNVGEEDDLGIASRGDWWKGGLYY